MKATPGTIGLRICALAALLAGCGFEQKPAVSPQPQPAPPPLPRSFTQTVEVFQVAFDMVLVPGDEAKGIKALYVGKHEVTWDEFMPWVYAGSAEIGDKPAAAVVRKKRLCPSALPYGDITRGYGTDRFPALSMSWLNADTYCAWLSAETGRSYRVPANREWEHIFRLSRGGAATELSAADAERLAVFEVNSFDDENGDYQTRRVGSMDPDHLGLYDLSGNVAEWVSETGDVHVVRGGHFRSPLEELGARGWLVEDQAIWNMNYPNEPKNRCWYVDAKWVGFRLVCEP